MMPASDLSDLIYLMPSLTTSKKQVRRLTGAPDVSLQA
jgi:hypothetical protein